MGNTTNPEKWDARQRLSFIEMAAFWRGWVGRGDLEREFGISLPQASADLQAYLAQFPDALRYDLKAKKYLATDSIECRLSPPNFAHAASKFLGSESEVQTTGDLVATIDLPLRAAEPHIVRQVFRAVHDKLAVQIHYLSINSATASWRWISPHAFGHDGYRWHARAFCHESNGYKDFVLGRITDAKAPEPKSEPPGPDTDWNTWEKLVLRPNGALDPVQRKAVEFDYAMRQGKVTLDVRRAMLEYTLAYLRLSKKHFPRQLELEPE
jgi:predicted DNA-binding transcriptional regulator YafY